MSRRPMRAVATVLALVTVGAVPLSVAVPAAAAGCSRVMSVGYVAPPNTNAIEITPAKVSVRPGDCVGFTNNTVPAATITVAGGYSVTLAYGESTTEANSYHGRSSGTFAVTASNGPATAHGRITVSSATSPSPSPTRSSTSPAQSPPPRPSASSSSSRPEVVPPASPRPPRSPVALPTPSGLPTTTSPLPQVTPSVASPSASPAAAVAGPVQPPTSRGLGLPASLAALIVVGVGAAFVRVLLAHAPVVDSRGTVGPAA